MIGSEATIKRAGEAATAAAPDLPVVPTAGGLCRISPTNLSQFIRLDQCERYLRLRLHHNTEGLGFMRSRGLNPQELPDLLSRSGAGFEQRVEAAIAASLPALRLGEAERDAGTTVHHGALRSLACSLAPGEARVVFQPTIEVALDGWLATGTLDVLRLERGADGALRALIADVKSSAGVKVEHRLQVAFYAAMLEALLAEDGLEPASVDLGVIYRGPIEDAPRITPEDRRRLDEHRAGAERAFGADLAAVAYLEVVADPAHYRDALADLVLKPEALARRVAGAPFAALPFCLAPKCDGCLYNEFCLRDCAERDDLSLIPHLSDGEKRALRRTGVATVADLARLKEPVAAQGADAPGTRRDLVTAPGHDELVRRLSATWPVGPRLDELVHRARRIRKAQGDVIDVSWSIPSRDYPSLPISTPDQNANLVCVYLDAQHDYLEDRVYLLGALVVGHEGGEPHPQRRRAVTRLAGAPVDGAEREDALLVEWIEATLRAIVEVAAPDEAGEPRAPIHLVFFDEAEQARLLDALARHAHRILAATPVYDLLTQLAAFDSPVVTYLDREVRNHKNYPLLCQSLQSVAAFLGFDWDTPHPFRDVFRHRVFDSQGRLGEPDDPRAPFYTRRARFSSQIPLEYAYAAWSELDETRRGDELVAYRRASTDLLAAFEERRLAAMEHVAANLPKNRFTRLTPFTLPDLASYEAAAPTLAHALDEFVVLERHAELAAWKAARLAPPERRVLAGLTLIGRYEEALQEPETLEQNRTNVERWTKQQDLLDAARALNPEERPILSKEQRKETDWSQDGLRVRLRLSLDGVDCGVEEAIALSTLKPGDRVVLSPRWTEDSRLPPDQRQPQTPTARQLLYAMRATLDRIVVEGAGDGTAVAYMDVVLQGGFAPKDAAGFVFGTIESRPFLEGTLYTLDEDPTDWYGYFTKKVTQGLVQGGASALYRRLVAPAEVAAAWPPAAAEGQARFLAGLDALRAAGAFFDLEPGKRRYVGELGEAPTVLVQGPPGTGKSFSTAFAILARLQGAMAADRPYRIVVSCKTHAATDVLLRNVHEARELLRQAAERHGDLFARYFDARLLDLPLFRFNPRDEPPGGVFLVPPDRERPKGLGLPRAVEVLERNPWCVWATAPAGIYRIIADRWDARSLFGHELVDAVVLDEASQMNLPEAIMAALPLKPDGHLIVVGDHRQMPPIVKHDWASEQRRTFRQFRSYESLFLTLLPFVESHGLPIVRFEESFRLHAEMAEFLRREVYAQDAIPYHSRRRETLPPHAPPDPYLAAVLAPEHPLVVVVHSEADSQHRNPFEQDLIAAVLNALADPERYGLGPIDGVGVVVPHRAQRAALQEAVPALTVRDGATGLVTLSAVDTVERFQGGERRVILVGATESDRGYLLASAGFLLDPRRLNVALSRAKQKMVLVAARSIFDLFSADDETFVNAQLWKNLLRRTCTVPLWQGQIAGHVVEVWGNAPSVPQA